MTDARAETLQGTSVQEHALRHDFRNWLIRSSPTHGPPVFDWHPGCRYAAPVHDS